MRVLHEPVAVREELCFAPMGRITESMEMLLGRGSKVRILKSEDLPVMGTVDHEDLVNAEKANEEFVLFCM